MLTSSTDKSLVVAPCLFTFRVIFIWKLHMLNSALHS